MSSRDLNCPISTDRYRVNPPSFRSQRWGKTFISGFETLKAHVQRRHPSLKTDFPSKVPLKSAALEPVRWDAPFRQALAHTDRQIMFIVPWLYFGGADIGEPTLPPDRPRMQVILSLTRTKRRAGLLHMVELYAQAGYRVTVVCTLSKVPDGLQLRPWVLQYTHDVHVLPSTVRARDMPRYLVHLIRSRGIQEVIFSNSQLIYEMLPALVEQVPHVKWIDVSFRCRLSPRGALVDGRLACSTSTTKPTTVGRWAGTRATRSWSSGTSRGRSRAHST